MSSSERNLSHSYCAPTGNSGKEKEHFVTSESVIVIALCDGWDILERGGFFFVELATECFPAGIRSKKNPKTVTNISELTMLICIVFDC